jgi:putative ABC transport system permease protein
LAAGDALLSERLARDLGVATNDSIVVADTVLRIRGVFPGFGDLQPRLLVDNTTASTLASSLGIPLHYDRLSVATGDAQRVAQVLRARFPQLSVQQRGVMRRSALQIFDRTFAITQALTLVALAVASIGLYNALLGLKLNQGPALVLLRSMGVSARERRRVSLWRALGVGSTVLLVALPAGVVMAWLLCDVINPRAFGWSLQLRFSMGAVLPPLLTGALAIILTSVLPTPHERLSEIGEGI